MPHRQLSEGATGISTSPLQVAQSLQRQPRAAEANGSEAGSQMRPPAANIWNGLECKLSTQSSKVCAAFPVTAPTRLQQCQSRNSVR